MEQPEEYSRQMSLLVLIEHIERLVGRSAIHDEVLH
jgi:hypothetical protein